jgi:hypothetical protein
MANITLKELNRLYDGAKDTFKLVQKDLLDFGEQPIIIENENFPNLKFEVELNLDNEITDVLIVAVGLDGEEIEIRVNDTLSVVQTFGLTKQEPLNGIMYALETLIQFEQENDLECELNYKTSSELVISFESDFNDYIITINEEDIIIEEEDLYEYGKEEDDDENKRARLEEARVEFDILKREIEELEEELRNN